MSQDNPKDGTFVTLDEGAMWPSIRPVQERVVLDPSTSTNGMSSVLVQEWARRSAIWREKYIPPVEPEVVTRRATDACCPSRRVDTGQGPIQDIAPSFLKQHPNHLKHQPLTHSKRITKTIELLDCGMIPHGIEQRVPHWRLNRSTRDLLTKPRLKQERGTEVHSSNSYFNSLLSQHDDKISRERSPERYKIQVEMKDPVVKPLASGGEDE
eukprot:CAMPEP_0118939138 /NCGR_PEP_ID=MMETSP1169-20130426/28076_1 /TAXON_ID=36882 /ORGANISM="Pyramimonas obovata, Strain CCMP722" /LENGTH=210 /DNA_ID=CAMNT_0006883329 /DNA_START=95 /DNA_END=727 /DNA_ORIENTATION=-